MTSFKVVSTVEPRDSRRGFRGEAFLSGDASLCTRQFGNVRVNAIHVLRSSILCIGFEYCAEVGLVMALLSFVNIDVWGFAFLWLCCAGDNQLRPRLVRKPSQHPTNADTTGSALWHMLLHLLSS